MSGETYTPAELVRLLRADVRALLVIAERYRAAMTPVEIATLQAVADALRTRAP